MKIFKYKIIFVVLTAFIAMKTSAQDYHSAIRLSSGTYWGASYKKMLTQDNGVMLNLQAGQKTLQLAALRIFHTPAFPSSSSKWFLGYGYGAHIAYHREIKSHNFFRPFAPPHVYKGHYVSPGIDGLISLEYRFLKYPFTLSGDFMPNFEFFGPEYFRMNMTNISFTFSFVL